MTDLGENTVELDAVAVADALAEITNKRREYRQRVLKGTTIIKGLGNSEIGCQVRKEHTGGAELRSQPRIACSGGIRCCTFRATASASSSPGAGPSLDSTMADRHGSVAAVGRRMRCRSQHVQAFEQSPSKEPTR